MTIEIGMTHELTFTVQESDTARSSGGESLPPVLSTPRVIGYLERTAHLLLLPHLPDTQTSVGTLVNIRHLAATPVGMQVHFHARLVEIDRRRMRFVVEAWDEVEKVAEGEHERFIIDKERFIQRLEEKAKKISS